MLPPRIPRHPQLKATHQRSPPRPVPDLLCRRLLTKALIRTVEQVGLLNLTSLKAALLASDGIVVRQRRTLIRN